MNNLELNQKINDYLRKLSDNLASVKEEKAKLKEECLNFIVKGEKVPNQLRKDIAEVNIEASSYEEKTQILQEFMRTANVGDYLENLRHNNVLNDTEMVTLVDFIMQSHEKVEDESISVFVKNNNEEDINKVVASLKKYLDNLNTDIIIAEVNGKNTTQLKEKATKIEETLKKLNDYQNNQITSDGVQKELVKLSHKTTSNKVKDTIFSKYMTIIENGEKASLKTIKPIIKSYDFEDWFYDTYGEYVDFADWYESVFNENLNETRDGKEKKGNSEEKTKLKQKAKEKLAQFGNKLNKHKKAIITICGTVILAAAIIFEAKSCSKQINNTSDNSNTDPTNIEEIYDDTYDNNNTVIDSIAPAEVENNTEIEIETPINANITALVNKGYNEAKATEMVEHFSEDTINALLNSPYIAEVENYSTVDDFNLDYINDYEEARNVFVLNSANAVDYVNRSYKISETGFYSEASIQDIVEVVMAIDNKDLFMTSNAALAQSFNTSFNRVTDNYLFGTVTDEDIKKIDALQYFAKDGTDMDDFLTNFGTLMQNMLQNPTNADAKDEMYQYLYIFATSLNGFTNEPEVLTDNEAFNTNAQVNDYFDWYMAYESFIAPLYPTYTTYDGDTAIIENKVMALNSNGEFAEDYYSRATYIVKNYNYSEDLRNIFNTEEIRYLEYQTLQELMLTALTDPEIEKICGGQSLTLGGE